MALYLIRQVPRQKYRAALVTPAVIIEAPTAAAAIRRALAIGDGSNEKWFGPSADYCAPEAKPLTTGDLFFT